MRLMLMSALAVSLECLILSMASMLHQAQAGPSKVFFSVNHSLSQSRMFDIVPPVARHLQLGSFFDPGALINACCILALFYVRLLTSRCSYAVARGSKHLFPSHSHRPATCPAPVSERSSLRMGFVQGATTCFQYPSCPNITHARVNRMCSVMNMVHEGLECLQIFAASCAWI